MTSAFLYSTRLERPNSGTVLGSHCDACWLYSVLIICISSQVRLSTAPALIWRVAALAYLADGILILRVRHCMVVVLCKNHAGAACLGYREYVRMVGANEANLGNSNLFNLDRSVTFRPTSVH